MLRDIFGFFFPDDIAAKADRVIRGDINFCYTDLNERFPSHYPWRAKRKENAQKAAAGQREQ